MTYATPYVGGTIGVSGVFAFSPAVRYPDASNNLPGCAVMAKIGRPSTYTVKIGNAICDYMANGDSLRTISARPGMPTGKAIRKWRESFPAFSAQYERARIDQAEWFFDEAIRVASTPMMGETVVTGPLGVTTTRADMLGHRRLLFDALKWAESKRRLREGVDEDDSVTIHGGLPD